MNSITKRTVLLCLFLFVLSGSPRIYGKETWISVKSKNFNLVGNTSEKEIKQVATKLEQFREVFSHLFPNAKLVSTVPTNVIVFKSKGSFKPFKPVADGKTLEGIAGYFQSGADVNYITLTTETASEDPFHTIFHEYVHLLVNNTLGRGRVPTWFNEGLAEYYSTFEIKDARQVSLGKPLGSHLRLLRSTKLWPLKAIFDMDQYSLQRNKQDARGMFYAQSWALVHYLIQGNDGKRLQQFGEFLQLIMNNTQVDLAFRDAMKMDYATLEKELRGYIQRATYRINVATFERKLEFDADMETAVLSEADAHAYLGDLLLHMNRSEEAVAKLQQALALDADHQMGHASLGMALLRQKKYLEAKAHLEKAVNLGANNYLAHYYYAYLLTREGMDENDLAHGYTAENAALMRKHLERSIQAKPDFGESYRLLAFVNLVTNENLDEALEQIKKALALSPGSEDYLFVLAQIYLRKQDVDSARTIIEPLATSSSDPGIRATAQGILRSVKEFQAQLAQFEKQKASRLQALGNTTRSQVNEIVASAPEVVSITNSSSKYLEEALRQPGQGERRVQGTLVTIDCSSKAIVFTLKVGEQLHKYSSPNFNDVDITTFTQDVVGELTCGVRKAPESVILTYSDQRDERAKTDGTAIALEFVPPDFKLSN